jgi:hypothetical protein
MSFYIKYKKLIEESKMITKTQMERGKFYAIKEYTDVDGINHKYSPNDMPIVFTLFVSRPKDIVHCVKVTDMDIKFTKKLLGKLTNKKTETLDLKKENPRVLYKTKVKKIGMVRNNTYRTYKLSGIDKVMLLDMELTELVPSNIKIKDNDSIKRPKTKSKTEYDEVDEKIKKKERRTLSKTQKDKEDNKD